MDHIYKVPLISQDLTNVETIAEIVDALNHLHRITDEIMKQITKRIDLNCTQLTSLHHRLDRINERITSIRDTERALQIIAPCKYPAERAHKRYRSIFNQLQPIEMFRNDISSNENNSKLNTGQISSPSSSQSAVVFDEKLSVYHVNINDRIETNVYDAQEYSLSRLPTHSIAYINDTFLFNTGKSIYNHFNLYAPLPYPKQTPSDQSEITVMVDGRDECNFEPCTVQLNTTSDQYYYTPISNKVPKFDVPLDLPDLRGIANNIRYSNDCSASRNSGIKTDINVSITSQTIPLVTDTNPTAVTSENHSNTIVNQLENIAISNDYSKQLPTIETTIPPPITVSMPSSSGDLHASLMDSIRKAGGSKNANLKSTVKRVHSQKNHIDGAVNGGDLMADLHLKLSMRRKGIFGVKQTSGTTVLDKISAMIPQPEQNNSDLSLSDTNDDWDD